MLFNKNDVGFLERYWAQLYAGSCPMAVCCSAIAVERDHKACCSFVRDDCSKAFFKPRGQNKGDSDE